MPRGLIAKPRSGEHHDLYRLPGRGSSEVNTWGLALGMGT